MMDVCEEKADDFASDKFILRKDWPLVRCMSFLFNPSRQAASSSLIPGHEVLEQGGQTADTFS